MDKGDYDLLKKYIKDVVLNNYKGHQNDEITRSLITYDIRNFLQNCHMEWTTLNTHTSLEDVWRGTINVVVDGKQLLLD